MALTEEQWKEILNAVEFSNNLGDVLEQVKAKLKEQYQEWEQKCFDVNHLFNISLSTQDYKTKKYTLLHIAARNGYLDIVKYLVEQRHVDVNQVDNDGTTALHWTAYNGHLDIVKYLVEQRHVDVNQVDNDGNTALHGAAYNGHLDTVRYFVEQRHVNVNQVGTCGTVALHFAAYNGHLDTVKYLVEQRHVDVNQAINNGTSALHGAALNGHLDIVKYLIEQKNVDVNQVANNGRTALHRATGSGYLDTVKYLIEQRHVDVNKVDNDGLTALHLAAQNGQLDTVKYLIEQKNVDVNQTNNNGNTALHLAAYNGHLDTVKYLVEQKNVDVNRASNSDDTALHLAAFNGHLDVVKVLLDRGADIKVQNQDGNTPLHYAIARGYKKTAELLIRHEVKLNPSDVKKPSYLEHPNSDCAREMSEYWDKCLDELKRMKEEKIGGDITFYSILVSKSIDKLVCYIRNEQFTKVLERSNYRNKFPIYANDLDYLFKKAKQRVEALNIGEIVIKHFDGFSRGGPAHLKIAEYLSNEDLKNLRKAAIQTMDEEDVSKSLGSDVRVESAAKKQGMQT